MKALKFFVGVTLILGINPALYSQTTPPAGPATTPGAAAPAVPASTAKVTKAQARKLITLYKKQESLINKNPPSEVISQTLSRVATNLKGILEQVELDDTKFYKALVKKIAQLAGGFNFESEFNAVKSNKVSKTLLTVQPGKPGKLERLKNMATKMHGGNTSGKQIEAYLKYLTSKSIVKPGIIPKVFKVTKKEKPEEILQEATAVKELLDILIPKLGGGAAPAATTAATPTV